MVAVQAPSHVIDQIKNATGLVDVSISESIELTPVLVLAVSLLYMMSSDGRIEEEESSQFQSVVGGNEALLSYAVAYIQRMPVEDFLKQAPSVLSTQDKLCILSNVCDSMLSDGSCEPAELDLFQKLQTAFGVATSVFKPYFKAIQLKNDKTVLGPFVAIHAGAAPDITPHLALAVSLLYMMSADGSLGQEEIGQLETVIGEFEGLQKAALAYVRAVKREEFFKQAAPVLTKAQKLCILTNVCDSMMSDGVVAVVEDKLFLSMMGALGLQVSEFDEFHKVLETKNFKPFDTSKFENRTSHSRATGAARQDGEVFDMAESESEMGMEVRRTMHDNIERVQKDFGSDENVIQVNHNATDDLNIQNVSEAANASVNVQTIDVDHTDLNLQKVDAASAAKNVQVLTPAGGGQANKQRVATEPTHVSPEWLNGQSAPKNQVSLDVSVDTSARVQIDLETIKPNQQSLDVAVTEVNTQALGDESIDTHFEVLPPEVRVKNLFEDIEVLTNQLDRFESRNKKLLAAAKQARLLKETQRVEAEKLAQAQSVPLAGDATTPSMGLEKAHVQTNLQPTGVDVLVTNTQKIGADTLPNNWQTLAPTDAANSHAHHEDPNLGQVQASVSNGLNDLNDSVASKDAVRSAASSLGRHAGRTARRQAPSSRRHDFKVYMKFAMTFFVLSFWSSNIAAVHRDVPRVVIGKLERLSHVQADAEGLQSP